MLARDVKQWANEEIIGAIDDKIKEIVESRGDDEIQYLDEEIMLRKQRDRIAKMLGMPLDSRRRQAAP